MSQLEVARTAAEPSSPARPNCALKGLELRACVSGETRPDRQSLASGAARKPQLPAHFSMLGEARLPVSVGVRMVRSDGRISSTRPALCSGVGSDEPNPRPLVRGADV